MIDSGETPLSWQGVPSSDPDTTTLRVGSGAGIQPRLASSKRVIQPVEKRVIVVFPQLLVSFIQPVYNKFTNSTTLVLAGRGGLFSALQVK